MKKNIIILTIILSLSLSVMGQTNKNSIDGLKFSKAFFHSFRTDKLRDYIAIDTTITIEKGKVWYVSDVKAFMVNRKFNPYENEISLWIDDQIIYYYKSKFTNSIWLPAGTYNLKLMSVLGDKNLDFIFYLSGIEYSIEK